jgi:hypothetical protein
MLKVFVKKIATNLRWRHRAFWDQREARTFAEGPRPDEMIRAVIYGQVR